MPRGRHGNDAYSIVTVSANPHIFRDLSFSPVKHLAFSGIERALSRIFVEINKISEDLGRNEQILTVVKLLSNIGQPALVSSVQYPLVRITV